MVSSKSTIPRRSSYRQSLDLEESIKLRTVSFLIYKASSILDCNSLKILYVSLFIHILTIAVRFGEIHTKQVYNVYLYYQKEY